MLRNYASLHLVRLGWSYVAGGMTEPSAAERKKREREKKKERERKETRMTELSELVWPCGKALGW